MKKLLLVLALSGCIAAGHAQEILLGTDFKMYFDNKEFGSNESPCRDWTSNRARTSRPG